MNTRARRRDHRAEVEQKSRQLGLKYQADADDVLAGYPGATAMPLFGDWSSATNRMSGSVRRTPVEVFDYKASRTDAGSDGDVTTVTTRRTVVLVPGFDLPEFDLVSDHAAKYLLKKTGVEGLSFDTAGLSEDGAGLVEAFRDRCLVRPLGAADDDADAGDGGPVRRLFPLDVVGTLAARPGWSAQSSGGHLALWRGEGNELAVALGMSAGFVPAEDRPGLNEDAVAIADALRAAHDRPASSTGLPPVPAGIVQARGGRETGGRLGAFAGAAFGFFGGFGLFAAWMIANKGESAGRYVLAVMPAASLGGAAVGAFAGSRLGRRLIPVPAGAGPWRRLSAIGPGVGVVLGVILGGAVGGSAVSRLAPAEGPTWVAAVLFFGGIGACAALGLILGGFLTLSVHARRAYAAPRTPTP